MSEAATSAPSDDRPFAREVTPHHWPGDWGGHIWPKDREVRSPDGTRIRYTVRGVDDGPWLVLCAGFMCPDNFWATVGPKLMERYRVIVMNYRSVGASGHPREPGYRARRIHSDDYTIEKFAEDVTAVLDAEDVDEVTALGHSMGCQVALEVYNQNGPARVRSLVLVTGPYASPLHTFYGSKLGAYLFPFAYVGLPFLPRPVQKAIPKAVRLPFALDAARLIKALGPETPDDGMDLYFEHFSNGDPAIMLKIANGMHRYDASSFLHEIEAPTLVVVGTEDRFTPPEIGEVFLDRIPTCELVEIDGGTHGAIIEFPVEIHSAIADFQHRHLGHEAVDPEGNPDVISDHRFS